MIATAFKPSLDSAASLAAWADWLDDQGETTRSSLIRSLFALKCAFPRLSQHITSRMLLDVFAKGQVWNVHRQHFVLLNNRSDHLTDGRVLWRASSREKHAWRARRVEESKTLAYSPDWISDAWPKAKSPPLQGEHWESADDHFRIRLSNRWAINARYLAWALGKWPRLSLHEPVWPKHPLAVLVGGEVVAAIMPSGDPS